VTDELSLSEFGVEESSLDSGATPASDGDELPRSIVPGVISAPRGYHLLERIGEGGMGVVHKALHLTLDRTVAIKFLREGLLGASGEDLFYAEARSMGRLRHPNVVQVLDAGEVEGRPYLVMDLVAGVNLLDLSREWGEEIPIREACRVLSEVARGVDYCNRQGLVHCDINPRNILVDQDGHPYITDFGIARALGTVTRDTVLDYGTHAYLAPERLRRGDVVDARTDVYALGAVLYFLVTRRHPFTGRSSRAVLRKVLERDPVPPRQLSPRLSLDAETIILKAMEKEPDQRYQTVAELQEELDRYLRGEAIAARRLSWVGKLRRFGASHRTAVIMVGLAFLAFAAGAAHVQSLRMRAAAWEETSRALDEQIATQVTVSRQREESTRLELDGFRRQVEELREDVSRARAEYAALSSEYLRQQREQAKLQRQRDQLLRERTELLARKEEALQVAEQRIQELMASSQEGREAAMELAQARQTLARQELELEKRERALRAQESLVEQVLEEKKEALSRAQARMDKEVERETVTLMRMVRDPNPRTRVLALQKLAQRADPRTVQAITDRARRDDAPDVRAAAVQALATMGEDRALDAIARELSRDEDPGVRIALVHALGRHLDPDRTALLERVLAEEQSTDVLLAALAALERGQCKEAAAAVAGILTRPYVPSEPLTRARVGAISTLAQLRPREQRWSRRLLPLLEDPQVEVREAAARALGVYPFEQVVRQVARRHRDQSDRVRRAAVQTLRVLALPPGPEAVRQEALEGLIDFLEDERIAVANLADQALRSLTGEDAGWRPDAPAAERRAAARRWKQLIR
jgi:HEAT repeat protein